MANKINPADLVKLFSTVQGVMNSQKNALNQADTYNNDHGDHMVEIFQTITQAMQEKQDTTPADQFSHASQLLGKQQSGSAQVYAQGLAQAAQLFSGEDAIPVENSMALVQTLLGAGQQPAADSAGDAVEMLGALLGGAQGPGTGSSQAGQGGLLGNIDLADVVNAGAAFLNAKKEGDSNIEAALEALMAGSAMSGSSHREASGAMVANALLQAVGTLAKKK
ncbi:MAG: hypothetical protein JXA13_12045 [Anaerolineales bacterium]|nr:hypothetical protein [Anaerolineales bacterium]